MSELKRKAIHGAGWTVGARVTRSVLGIATLGVISRYLGPTEFGIAALVTFVTSMAQVLADLGTRVALVQKKDITELERNSVYWLNIAIGIIITASIFVFARPIAVLLGDESIVGPLRWVSPIFLLIAIQSLPATTMERRLAFFQIAVTEVISHIVGAITAIAVVMAGGKVEALIAQQMVITLCSVVMLSVISRWRPKFMFSYQSIKPLLSFGSYITFTGLLQTLADMVERPIIGNRLTPADLGYLAIVNQIVITPYRIIVQMVRRVMFPIMSSIQDDDARMRRGLLEMQYGLAVIMAPICAGLWALSVPIVKFLLGPGWEMVSVIMAYSAVRLVFSIYFDVNAIILSAKGHAKFQFWWSVMSLTLNIILLLVFVPYGIVSIVISRLFLSVFLLPIQSWFSVRLIGMTLMDRVLVTFRPLLSAVTMALAVWWADHYISGLGGQTFARLSFGIPLGVLVYLGAEVLIDREKFVPYARMFWGILLRTKR